MKTPALGPAERGEALARMADRELDVLVVGGGVVGAGTALDAATRGLETALVESRDWACGTSSRSSKLVHGGLRYLEMLDFALVREALKERGLLLERIAPHLVKPVPFLYPLQHRAWERLYAGSGVALYDAMSISSGHGRGLPAHRHLSRRRALQVAPCLKKDALVGALQYYDAQMDDARYVATLVRTAAKYGAQVANRARVVGFLREGERVVGARVHDLEQGGEFEVRARQVVNATGVWTDETQALIGERGQFHVRASKGIHLVVPKDRIHSTTGLILRTEKSVLFVIPWGRHWIVGTTDTDWDLDKAHPAASSADIDYLLEHVNEVLAVPLTRDDVEGVYAGLRPLLAGESDATSKLSREHTVAHPVPGLVVVAGGKYTTYRVMAKDAVDEAVHGLDRRVGPCVTEEIPLVGAVGYKALWNARERIGRQAGLHAARIEHLLNRYGSATQEVLDLIAADPSLGKPLAGAEDYLRAEIVYGVSHEGARHLDDVLTRRTRISIETFDRGTRCAREAAELMAPVLGWGQDQTDREVEHYEKRVEAERESQRQPDDLTADAARLGAPDIIPL
ncbi:glycerol-3-phosphate dehydrogenase/oxidase [Streptomyces antimycoticus]|uniref:Glycerol-3-phosphate dehydrogenase n=3 Tax=Streptomyces TaxID=1883 RepID=A0ABD5J7M4_9ACTN|nr:MULTISPECIES: glycerol-3-phosphate dehydrogenase/oxidase [Streptomyces]MEE4583602.1 glycerol-3-phosphate dehydrogenase/oxidase [Streptomyces sp. DSM 41602]AJZ82353.1 glycerol-3-phosphate dehydrogenase/oxidase [Streptomyces sp. AgN23]KUL44291.1 glycerol-3-phosphate dehydrogenase [Streptomyces violaceusniger]RSS37788.1 glycerol-3-phosphate dehydrogenase/oxidase [Streptomyces sp. WAC05858]WJD97829.1 glycerol-3-phosphate dehydrogenase/oxidase [Streptomyces antimycoticus]